MKDRKDKIEIEKIEHKFPVLLEVVQETPISKIELEDFVVEKNEYKELVFEESEDDKKSKEKANTILDSLYLKLIKIGLTEEEIIYLGIESIDVRSKKIKSNNSDNSKKK